MTATATAMTATAATTATRRCRHDDDRPPRPLDAGGPPGVRPARTALRRAARHRVADRAAVIWERSNRAGRPRPGLPRTGRLPRLVGRRAERVHDHAGARDPRLPAGGAGTGPL